MLSTGSVCREHSSGRTDSQELKFSAVFKLISSSIRIFHLKKNPISRYTLSVNCAIRAHRQVQLSPLSPHFCHPNNLSLFLLSYYSFFPEKSYWTCITRLSQCKSQSLRGWRWDSISAFSRAAPYRKSYQLFFFFTVVPTSKHPQKHIMTQWLWASLPSTET